MPATKTSTKRLRTSERKRLHNKSVHSLVKTNITKAEKLIMAGDADSARTAVIAAISSLDKATEKGTLHPGNAARRKSRLMRKLDKMVPVTVAAALPEAEPKKPKAKVKPKAVTKKTAAKKTRSPSKKAS